MNWIGEVRAVIAREREQLGIQGRPVLADTYRLIEEHPELKVRWEIGIPTHLRDREETGTIYMCPLLDDEKRNDGLLEEAGHWLLRHLSYQQPTLRDYLLGDGKHENPAGAFALLWRFSGISGTDEDLLAEGYSPEEVTRFGELLLRG